MSNHLLKAGLALESDKYTRALFSRALKTSKGWSLCNPFGQPALLLSFTHGGGKVFFICNLNFLCFKFYLFCHAPIMHDSDTLTLSSLKPSHCGVQQDALVCSPQSSFLLQAEQVPVPQLLLTGQVFLTETIPPDGCLSSTRGAQNWIQCLEVVLQVLNRGEQSLPCTMLLFTLLGCCWPSSLPL